MGAHAITSPLGLAHPTPLEAAASACADHVHAATCEAKELIGVTCVYCLLHKILRLLPPLCYHMRCILTITLRRRATFWTGFGADFDCHIAGFFPTSFSGALEWTFDIVITQAVEGFKGYNSHWDPRCIHKSWTRFPWRPRAGIRQCGSPAGSCDRRHNHNRSGR